MALYEPLAVLELILATVGTSVTVVVAGDPVKVVLAFPATSLTEKELATVRVDVAGEPDAAVEIAEIVQTVEEV